MQASIKHCEDYYVGKRKANEMHGIDHKSKILLDHLDDTKSFAPNAPVVTMMSTMKMIQMIIMNLTLTMT